MEFTDKPLVPFGKVLLDLRVQNNLGFKTPLVYRVLKLLKENACLPPIGNHMAELCFEEALVNAMLHGNKNDPDKHIRLQLFADDQRWGLVLEDEGAGFKASDVPDPEDPESLMLDHGRGVLLMDHYLDELLYNAKGNKVMMARRRQTEPDASAIEAERAAHAALVQAQLTPDEPKLARGVTKVTLSGDIGLDIPEDGDDAGPSLLATRDEAGVRVIIAEFDRLTQDNVEAVRPLLYQACTGQKLIVLDLGKLKFMSSVGIGTVMTAYKRVAQEKGKMVMAGASPAVHEIFMATGLGKLLRFEPSVAAALAKLK